MSEQSAAADELDMSYNTLQCQAASTVISGTHNLIDERCWFALLKAASLYRADPKDFLPLTDLQTMFEAHTSVRVCLQLKFPAQRSIYDMMQQ